MQQRILTSTCALMLLAVVVALGVSSVEGKSRHHGSGATPPAALDALLPSSGDGSSSSSSSVMSRHQSRLSFYEEPSDTYLTRSMPAVLKCQIENARAGFFKCNDQWVQEPANFKIIQIGNRQILTIEMSISKLQLDEYQRSAAMSHTTARTLQQDAGSNDEDQAAVTAAPPLPFACTCQGWLNSADETIISRKAFVKAAYLRANFEWEPLPTAALVGKSVEIRCLPPDGEPKPHVYWLRDGQPIERANAKRVIVSNEASLLINEVRASDAANYTCVAENMAGKRRSESAQLTVSDEPSSAASSAAASGLSNGGDSGGYGNGNDGVWSDWSAWSECTVGASVIPCGEGTQKRTRLCISVAISLPPTAAPALLALSPLIAATPVVYQKKPQSQSQSQSQSQPQQQNSSRCSGAATQSAPCFVPCSGRNTLLHGPGLSDDSENMKKLNQYIAVKMRGGPNKPPSDLGSPYAQLSKEEISFWWSSWSPWSMICNADCMRSRRRECKPGYFTSGGKLLAVSEEKLVELKMKAAPCPGADVDYSNCTFFCERDHSNIVPVLLNKKDPSLANSQMLKRYLILTTVAVSVAFVILFALFVLIRRAHERLKQRRVRRKNGLAPRSLSGVSGSNGGAGGVGDQPPIYYSVQPEIYFDQDQESTTSSSGGHSCSTAPLQHHDMYAADSARALLSPTPDTCPNQHQHQHLQQQHSSASYQQYQKYQQQQQQQFAGQHQASSARASIARLLSIGSTSGAACPLHSSAGGSPMIKASAYTTYSSNQGVSAASSKTASAMRGSKQKGSLTPSEYYLTPMSPSASAAPGYLTGKNASLLSPLAPNGPMDNSAHSAAALASTTAPTHCSGCSYHLQHSQNSSGGVGVGVGVGVCGTSTSSCCCDDSGIGGHGHGHELTSNLAVGGGGASSVSASNSASTTTTTSGSSSTTSSKCKMSVGGPGGGGGGGSGGVGLASSPTSSLLLRALPQHSPISHYNLQHQQQQQQHHHKQQTHLHLDAFDGIMQLIDERKTNVYSGKPVIGSTANSSNTCNGAQQLYQDMYSFGIHRSGGLVEIAKFAAQILVPDDTLDAELEAGVCRVQTGPFAADKLGLKLAADQTLLSAVFAVRARTAIAGNNSRRYSKPLVVSLDHAALFADTDWETSIYFKPLAASSSSSSSTVNTAAAVDFHEVNEQQELGLYSQVVGNRFYVMTEHDGLYALAGRPRSTSSSSNNNSNNSSNSSSSNSSSSSSSTSTAPCAVKQMKYAILLVEGRVKVYLAAHTSANGELLADEIQRCNGRIIKRPELFELHYPTRSRLDAAFLSLELSLSHGSLVLSSDSTCRKISLADVWAACSDFIEIDVPVGGAATWHGGSSSGSGHFFDLKCSLELEGRTLFSFSSLNTAACDLHTANCNNQQEFYSSVSVAPVFIPLEMTKLLDDYVMRFFKLATLKRNDWHLFADLLKCDKNAQYFASKENSFELIISMWLMINLSKAIERSESMTVSLITNSRKSLIS